MRLTLTLFLALTLAAAALPAQQVAVTPDSLTLAVGDTARVVATVKGVPDAAVSFTGSNASVFTAHRDGRITARGVGCAWSQISYGTWTRARIPVCVVAVPVDTAPSAPAEPAPSPAPAMLFSSDWRTATGRTAEAFRDAASRTPWDFACCDAATNAAVIAADDVPDWPTATAYLVRAQSAGIATHQLDVALGAPAPGTSRYFRYYLRVLYDDTHGPGDVGMIEHGVETAESGGGDGMNFYRIPRNDGTWMPGYREISTGWRYVAPGLRLAKQQTYRLEWHLAYGASDYTVEVRIYDAAGALVATEADFQQLLPRNDATLRLGTARFAYSPAGHSHLRVGINGPTSNFPLANPANDALFLHGAVAVCTDWCGPYRDGR